ncbi:hypothetical protein [Streptomyces sp. NPDC031705]|uniref:hypothetical protein n=1 Tax=Streptomyces sp. NPDC031705 TaxID=3155729 RepID=UPI0033D10C93
MPPADPVIDGLVAAARCVPDELVATLAGSDDLRTARLGQAIRELRSSAAHPVRSEVQDGSTAIDPVTHDPAW